MRIAIFGAGSLGRNLYQSMQCENHEVCIVDNDVNKQGNKAFLNGCILSPTELKEFRPQRVYIAVTTDVEAVAAQLCDLGIPEEAISTEYVMLPWKARIAFLESLSDYFCANKITGATAEAGVYRGQFAKEINRIFPKSRLYLFDTFNGFPQQDSEVEIREDFSDARAMELNDTSVALVKGLLPHPENAVFRVGYFPDTAEDIQEKFCFINLDLDLYQPTLSGLRKFYPLLVPGGVILVHDYFNLRFRGAKAAVQEFLKEMPEARCIPVGDGISIAIIK